MISAALVKTSVEVELADRLVLLLFGVQQSALFILSPLHRSSAGQDSSRATLLLAWSGTPLQLAIRATIYPSSAWHLF
ncbi:hypothetical protein [Candidatus Chloroploca sp. Khr17]|uniref:hypothetical protein n=1 Tax=Candidatus Chloroploca sp. Khr17 TaxID=2496869 RepID=UPI00101C95D2|nr:hypothetical protein [Candidatus Chloroploca sp. Khr17]